MFIVWGKKRVETRAGYVADFCPVCRDLQTFEVKRIGLAGHVYYISFSEGELVEHIRSCTTCGVDLNARLEDYREIHAQPLEPGQLALITQPQWKERHAGRLAIERELKTVLGTVDPEDRKAFILEPFRLLSYKVEQRFASTQFDGRTAIAIVAFFCLIGFVHALAERVPAAEDVILGAGWLGGIGAIVWQIATIRSRWMRANIYPILVRALRPIKPAPKREELQAALEEMKKRGDKIGKYVKLDALMSELEPPPPYAVGATQPIR